MSNDMVSSGPMARGRGGVVDRDSRDIIRDLGCSADVVPSKGKSRAKRWRPPGPRNRCDPVSVLRQFGARVALPGQIDVRLVVRDDGRV
jgi:hypothetical protein